VGESTNARITGKAALDTVIFGGNGVTGVVGILVDVLNLKGVVNAAANNENNGSNNNRPNNEDKRPVVFVGPHEHHSNLLPWRESGCEVISIPENSSGMVDLVHLEKLLQMPQYNAQSGRLRMGAFSAVSNVTGLIADVDQIAIILHRYGALAFFDYASGAPYVKMDMNPNPVKFRKVDGEMVDPSKDAIYFSPHKCYGGTSTPGVLVIKKHLISQTNPPAISGGGTVFYVTNTSHRFLSNRIERYEGGTPDGIGVQRVGLALLAGRRVSREYEKIAAQTTTAEGEMNNWEMNKQAPPKTLLEYECSTYDRVVSELKQHAPNLIMLGCTDDDNSMTSSVSPSSCIGKHLPIFSFLIRCGPRFLHYNYVCAILNDVFGIQSRGGCQCAGPYSQRLLGLTAILNNEEVPSDTNQQIERALLRSDRPCELLRPGYTRLSLPFKGVREEEVDYVIQALIWVAKNGWILLPQYRCDHKTGEWRHWSRRGKPLGKSERRWLSRYDILASSLDGKHSNGQTLQPFSEVVQASRARLNLAMENANAILHSAKHDPRFLSEVEKMNSAHGMLGSGATNDAGEGGVDDTLEQLRWYCYPQEVSHYLRDGLESVPDTLVDDSLLGGIYVRMDGNCRSCEDVGGNVALIVSEKIDKMPTAESMVQDVSVPEDSTPIPFQEGDHAGEAPYEEIKAGYDDGELSDACEVFSKTRDEWIPIEDFIQEYEHASAGLNASPDEVVSKKRNLSAMEETSPSCQGINSMKIDSSVSTNGTNTSTPLPHQPTRQSVNRTLPAAVQKREKKKPSRDSSQWGQCTAPHIATSNATDKTTSSSSAATTIDGNPNVEEETAVENSTQTPAPASSLKAEAMDISAPPAATSEPISNKKKKNKGKIKPPAKMMRFITQAMIQWDMVQEGDRLLLGLSGGKDSLSLLHCLLEFQRKLPIKFEIEVCTIDPMTPSFDPSPLIPYVEGLGLKYHYIRDDIVERANTAGKDGKTVSSLCAFCARMKRGNLYTCARKNNCNKLVLAQHLDDCAESFLMSVMHNGFIRTMKANYQINAGDVSVIRPLVYCRESLMTEFAKSANLPVINENCPACFEEPKERARVKKLLSREETLYPNLYDHIRRALIPVMHDDSTSIMRTYLEDTIAKSRKVPGKAKKAKISDGSNDVKMEKATALPNNGEKQNSSASLASATEDELIAELARRRASKFKLSGAMKRLPNEVAGVDDGLPPDATGQMCSLTGGDGMIPCRELME
jgi:selenocysteine lyase/cysteine desulfurase/tRNA(Ile)-lysidine synthase TilS/MesJ